MSQLNEVLAALHVYRQLDRVTQDARYNIIGSNILDKKKVIERVNVSLAALFVQLQNMSTIKLQKYNFEQEIYLRTAFATLKQIRHEETAKYVNLIFDNKLQFNNLRTQVTEIFLCIRN